MEARRRPHLRCLGAVAPWVDRGDLRAGPSVHGRADGDAEVLAAERFAPSPAEL